MTVIYETTSEGVASDCASWPEAEQAVWRALFDPDDPETFRRWARRREKPWSRPRQYNVAGVYTRYLRCVRAHALPEAIHPEGVRAFVAELQARCQPHTVHSQVCMLASIAHLLHPNDDWSWLTDTCRNLDRVGRNTPKRKNAGGKLLNAHDLYATGIALMIEAMESGGVTWAEIQTYRDGLWLALGTVCPERRRALETLTVDNVRVDAGLLDVPADVMKTGEASRRRLPAVIAEAIRTWLTVYRAAYAPNHNGFWIVKGGTPVRPGTMYPAMKKVTRERLGIAVSPHRLRDAGATFIAEEMPENANLASTLLKHRTEAMTRIYQEQAQQIEASKRFAQYVQAYMHSLNNHDTS
ncbi:hypothetical protein CKO28_15905 [Rhodovibrio sodomensis]|uniref:Tyr recombinase domain-containing protein n=1 Tax=Rhodovibrio sodomensis TaxID=1088 RepID=A0ABS1DH25_9PROT|nr:tyrosine-type recombinase/integrase [Rhodovibrio sodomensis]MBK1669524.1 hypothetical protein [Rhodovibrio sodomensis]